MVFLRVGLLTAGIASSLYLFMYSDYLVIPSLCAAFAVFMLVRIVVLIDRSENHFYNFLNAVKYFDLIYLENIGNKKTHARYRKLYEEVVDIFRKLKSEKEIHYENLQNIVQNIQTGIVCFNEAGEILLVNKSGLELLQRPHLSNIRSLENADPEVFSIMRDITMQEPRMIKRVIRNRITLLNIQAREFRIKGAYHKLVLVQNLKNELDTSEIESYQKLISVLTHEIMNSMTPVISLSEIIENELTEENLGQWKQGNIPEERAEEVRMSAKIISNRSKNLLRFVQSYRSLTKLPPPQAETLFLPDAVQKVEQLFRPELLQAAIAWEMDVQPDISPVIADTGQIEQTLINLVKNSIESLKQSTGERKIDVRIYSDEGRHYVDITDNGPGIGEEAMQNLFVPFFTTKLTGSGIGLNLCKQIMRQHGGNIYARSVPSQETTFTLEF